jgi:hypothetical protein
MYVPCVWFIVVYHFIGWSKHYVQLLCFLPLVKTFCKVINDIGQINQGLYITPYFVSMICVVANLGNLQFQLLFQSFAQVARAWIL